MIINEVATGFLPRVAFLACPSFADPVVEFAPPFLGPSSGYQLAGSLGQWIRVQIRLNRRGKSASRAIGLAGLSVSRMEWPIAYTAN